MHDETTIWGQGIDTQGPTRAVEIFQESAPYTDKWQRYGRFRLTHGETLTTISYPFRTKFCVSEPVEGDPEDLVSDCGKTVTIQCSDEGVISYEDGRPVIEVDVSGVSENPDDV
jgi:hypothetical protein